MLGASRRPRRPRGRGRVPLRLAQRRGHSIGIAYIDPTAGKGLTRVRAHVMGPFDQQHVAVRPALAEEDEHRRFSYAIVGRQQTAQLLGAYRRCGIHQRTQPVGNGGHVHLRRHR